VNETPQIQLDLDPQTLPSMLPEGPGVYLFKDGSGKIIYAGKAKNLKKRVLSYFRPAAELPHKTGVMMGKARGLDYILTTTEKEAFILESNIIKQHLPRYNIVLRDDKQYPWLRLDPGEPYPRLSIVRRVKKDGARYFGPFSSAHSVRSTLKLIDRIFQLRKCRGPNPPQRSRPCLNFQLSQCLGPCAQDVPAEVYKEFIGQVTLFLEGRSHELIKELKKSMEAAAENLDFEKAAKIRDQIKAVEKTVERQNVVSPKMEDKDVIGLAEREGVFQIVILFVRKGRLSGSRNYLVKNEGGSSSEVMEAFLKQFYDRETFVPKHVLISESVDDLPAIGEWISDMGSKRVYIEKPSRGEKQGLVRMAVANAENLLIHRKEPTAGDVLEMAEAVLKLRKRPRVMECVDVSNIQGNMAVGVIVSFLEGLPNKEGYRNFRIKGVEGIDDYGMMAEVIGRRLSKGSPPDLLVVDGGKGHLHAVKRVVDRIKDENPPDLAAIAKEDHKEEGEKVYIPGRKNPVNLRQDDPVLLLLMRIRDEAHRRAITYHRKLRKKAFTASELDHIPGLGTKRKHNLLKHFGSLEGIIGAREEDLAKVPGISPSLAERIKTFFHAL
jgi:excinuclease ABC subunit C